MRAAQPFARRSALLCGLLLAACSAQPLAVDNRLPVVWDPDVSTLLKDGCSGCHSGATPAGSYDTTTYLTAIGQRGRGGKGTVATAGDPTSLLLTKLDPTKANATHGSFAAAFAELQTWVVGDKLALRHGGVHEGGILNPLDDNFHGALLRERNYDFALCQKCHGADFAGGIANVSCLACHQAKNPDGSVGPTGCTTCHGQPPAQGAHLAHVNGTGLGKVLGCAECHSVPASATAAGHLLDAAGKPKTSATVKFSAANSPAGAAFDPSTGTCSNIACHGGAYADAKASVPKPLWTGGSSQAACGSCHGLPPANHVSTAECRTCHQLVAGPGNTIINPALHVDGIVQLGDGSGTCSACHGSAQSPAPPRDLAGNTDTTVITVGAHQAHLQAQHGISGKIACSACHAVPTDVNSPGHIDHTGPATVTFSGLALADSAAPSWNRATAGCSATYCHGGGLKLSGDIAPTLVRPPVWTAGVSQGACGACHGIPPRDTVHPATLGLDDCYKCHPGTVTDKGNIIVDAAGNSLHINGVIDHVP